MLSSLGPLGMAGAGLLPFVPLLESKGELADVVRRVVLLFMPNGVAQEQWRSSGEGRDFVLGESLAALAPYQDRMCVLDGLEVLRGQHGDGHQQGMGSLLTGSSLTLTNPGAEQPIYWAGGASIDQAIAAALAEQTFYGSLEFGVHNAKNWGHTVWNRMSYTGPEQPLVPQDNPIEMFDELFAGLDIDVAEHERYKAERLSVLDFVQQDLSSLRTRFGADDKAKVDAHLQWIRDLERQVELGRPACEKPSAVPAEFDYQANDNFPAVSRMMIDQLVMALSCDLARVASLQWSESVSETRFGWIECGHHHTLSHLNLDEDKSDDELLEMMQQIARIDTWYVEEVKYLLDAMDAIPEGDGTLLDHSLVVLGNELSAGKSHGNHPVPFLTFGSCGGAIETGRRIDYGQVEHNRLLVSLAQVMGLSIDSFGNHDPGAGGLPGFYG